MAGPTTDDSCSTSDEEWREHLSDWEYRILRKAGTEPPGSSDLLDVTADGTFECAGCGQVLFTTDEKFGSGTGWPSFYDPADNDAVETRTGHGSGWTRTEVVCSGCDGHLGHVFDDGPEPTGKRYCINGKALNFEED